MFKQVLLLHYCLDFKLNLKFMGDVIGSYFKVHQRFFSRPKSFQKSIVMMHDRPKG